MSNKKQKVTMRFKNDAFVTQLSDLLMKAGKVKIVGLGIFEIKKVAAREGYSVANGERITIKEHNKVTFRPTVKLKENIQSYEQGD